ncbi:MAG: CorA family divalent cation transporter [Bacillota bacterium]|nr:CorA family divalent cation transporter [Bacillota bacterium]
MSNYRFITIDEIHTIDEEVFSLLDGLKHKRFCKAEILDDAVVCGQIVIPSKHDDEDDVKNNKIFGFCTSNNGLYLINTPEELKLRFSTMRLNENEDKFGVLTLCTIISQLIKGDYYFLQSEEEDLKEIEDVIYSESDENDDVRLFEKRRKISVFTRYYAQLLTALEDILEFCQDVKMEEEEDAIGRLYRKVERLEAQSSFVEDYAKQLLDLHDSRVANKQNDIMQFLTIVTSIISPLTLITGWYGMNFVNMPELRTDKGYFVVIGICVLIVVTEITYMKRHKWFH